MKKTDVAAYDAAWLPEAERRSLPSAVRNAMSPQARDAVERSPLGGKSPPSLRGIKAKFVSTVGGQETSYEIDCAPLPSALLRCARREQRRGAVDQVVEQGVYAFGGLVPLATVAFDGPAGAPTAVNTPTNLRVRRGAVPALPSPGLDFIEDVRTEGGPVTWRTQCVPTQLTDPKLADLLRNTQSILVVCARGPDHVRIMAGAIEELDRATRREKDQPVLELPGGSVYVWSQALGLAIPVAFFSRMTWPGTGSLGYYGLWEGLSREGVKLQEVELVNPESGPGNRP